MSRNNKKTQPPEEEKRKRLFGDLDSGTRRVVWGISLSVVTIFLVLAALGLAGMAGDTFFKFFTFLLGIGYYLLPILSATLSITLLMSFEREFTTTKIIGALLFLVSGLGFIDLSLQKAGIVGHFITLPLLKMFDFYVSFAALAALLLISTVILYNSRVLFSPFGFLHKLLERQPKIHDTTTASNAKQEGAGTGEIAGEKKKEAEPLPSSDEKLRAPSQEKLHISNNSASTEKARTRSSPMVTPWSGTYIPPPLDLLKEDHGKPSVGDVKANANVIKRTLQNFGIVVEMSEVSIGPSFTRYALKPAEGVKLSRIVGMQRELALALAADPVRVEAPIPGKSLVGVEIPNSTKSIVGIGTLLGSPEFTQSEKPLLVGLGRDISGKAIFANLARMPHLLVAGATNSGKSVTIHALINSLLYRNSPENLQFIMVDPKRVELTAYNNIPHLLTPVITNAKTTIAALKWASQEMDRRYDIFEAEQVRDIDSYHKTILAPALKKAAEEKIPNEGASTLPERMPYLVIVVDELADIMPVYPRELESAIVRIAQMSRAVGIHLILSTQRPSVNIITGLIKANIPARIALQVTSQIDSRTILDIGGAEKLLGAGDMLYLSGEMSKPIRLQSAFISESETKNVVAYLRNAYYDRIPRELNLDANQNARTFFESAMSKDGRNAEDEDDLYEEAKQIVIEAKKASTSFLQRKLHVGYARAARLVDMLEERGIVGPGEGAKPRMLLGAENDFNDDEEDLIAYNS
ncbi:MAG: DNA segregation ATPase FtsK/SpoIIIE, S-DNA-T family [Parcubacteria group bacterium Gr01-1014_48]|nr:MAG: DNA segregation ATPase FtsK/SpoIIIE, S-DNA-T family [Parcubacteria group bacterium Greene0416_14]TSC72250.1 MAG: DNA segregation ATPase FtsK/SpoIIIE, S-DNA-T family [Parcubacteria group bacterium Gr01-1014_48]TSD00638.1 MAG: DNA segregation ATPase FtsK/SpoIIIE, S-DNA-T family [Parcubacteria group bacterium Greene1014_15]TSD08074.1 MAG: DNA segregation ATPase FtsK/SpoIIIE, S-DNA-T family [Parcubacteria group bacterium Greene0714_4]